MIIFYDKLTSLDEYYELIRNNFAIRDDLIIEYKLISVVNTNVEVLCGFSP